MQKTNVIRTRRIVATTGIGLLVANCVMADIAPWPSRNPNRPRPVPQKVEPVKPPVVNPPKPAPNDQKPPQPPPNVLPDKPVPPKPQPPAGEPSKVVPDKPVPPPPPPPPKPSLWQRIKSWF